MINSIKNWFWRSETIAWARLQVVFGVVWGVVAVADLSPLLSDKWLTVWLVFNGIVTEWLRRHNAEKTTVTVLEVAKDGSVADVPKSYLATVAPGP